MDPAPPANPIIPTDPALPPTGEGAAAAAVKQLCQPHLGIHLQAAAAALVMSAAAASSAATAAVAQQQGLLEAICPVSLPVV